MSEVTIFQRVSSGDLSRHAQEKQSNTLLTPKVISDALDVLRRLRNAQDRGVKAGGVAPSAGFGGPGCPAGEGGGRAAAGSAGRQGARAPRDPRLLPRRAFACRPAAHVFLFCVVAFVLEACIYILSVSGEWAGDLVWAGGKKALRFF